MRLNSASKQSPRLGLRDKRLVSVKAYPVKPRVKEEVAGKGRALVLPYGVIDAIGPGVNSASQVPNLIKTGLMENLDCLRTTRPHFADGDNLLTGIEFIQATRQLSERNQVAANIGGLKLELIAYIEQEEVLAGI